MAESPNPKTGNLTRDALPRDSSVIREDTEQIASAAHQDKHDYMCHSIAKMETNTGCLLDAQKHLQSGSQKYANIVIKEEVRDPDSEFPEQFEIPSREKCLSSHAITTEDVKDEVTEKEVDFHGQLEYFNSNQCVSGQEIIMTDVQGENKENVSALSGSECTQNIKNGFFEHKMYGIKLKEEFMENDAEPHNYFDANNIEKSFSPQKSILKNVKSEIIENEVTLTGDLKVQNSEKCIVQELNEINVKKEFAELETYSPEQLGILKNYQGFSDEKITITDVKGAVTDNETGLGLPRITNIKTCVSALTFNNTLMKREEPKDDEEFPKHFETIYSVQSGSVDKIIIANVKGGFGENETNLPGELRSQAVEKSVSEPKSNAVIVKVEEIEMESELPDNYFHLLKKIPAKGITDEKTPTEHICNVSCRNLCSKEKIARNMQIKIHPVKQFKCEICENVFQRKCRFSAHMNTHTKRKEFKCKFCNKIFLSKKSISKHLNLHTKETEFKCEICDKVYFLKSKLARHLLLHSNEEQRSCKFCGKLFSTRQHLKVHLNIHTKEKEFKCKFCDKIFPHKRSLLRHTNLHTKKRKYKCEICDNVYYDISQLPEHMQSHSNEEHRSCKLCGKLFSSTQNLKRHLNLHTKEKEFKCEECGKVFYRKDSLNNHKINHTEKKDV